MVPCEKIPQNNPYHMPMFVYFEKKTEFVCIFPRFVFRLQEAAKKGKLLNSYALETIMRVIFKQQKQQNKILELHTAAALFFAY